MFKVIENVKKVINYVYKYYIYETRGKIYFQNILR